MTKKSVKPECDVLAKPFYVGVTGVHLTRATRHAVAFGRTAKPWLNKQRIRISLPPL